MIEIFYPEEEQRFFTNREHFLALLNLSRDLLEQGVRKHLALCGYRRIGKTLILKEFLRRSRLPDSDPSMVTAYLDLPRLAFTPEAFSIQYLGHLLHWLLNKEGSRPEAYFSPSVQLSAAAGLGKPALADFFVRFHQELEKEKPDQHLLLEMAFSAPEVAAQLTGKKMMLFLDEFPDLLALNNYPQVQDILALFRSVLQGQSHICYVVAGSMMSLMEQIFLEASSPLFVHFQLETVGPFGRQDSDELARKRLALLADSVPIEVLAEVYQLTRGHPFYIYSVCMRILEDIALLQKPLNLQTVQEAFTLETLGSTGRIYNLCRYITEGSLQRVRGETMPQAILQTLAQSLSGMRLTEIGRRLKRPTGATRQVLNWLIEVDLLQQQEDKRYIFRDPVLQLWTAYYYSGLQLTGLPSQKALKDLAAELMEKYERVSNELGRAKESQVRELLHDFDGQQVDGALFGLSGLINLPRFKKVTSYRSEDGLTEIDALAEGEERWVVEIKWRGKLSGKREVEKLMRAANGLAARAWLISKAGFTQEAQEFAHQHKIMISSQTEIEALIKSMRK